MSRPMMILAGVALALGGTVAAYAQGLSDEEMLSRFKAQKEIYQSATGPGATRSLGTRGLTIVTVAEEPAATGATVQPSGGGTVAAPPGITPQDPNLPLVAARFEPDLAVDVRIEFAFDSAAISPDQEPALQQVCRVMSQATEIGRFRIVGHTDGKGSDAYDQSLSQLRAEEVGRYLVDSCGIAPSRVETVGYGKQFLAVPDDPAAAANRRVEFQALG